MGLFNQDELATHRGAMTASRDGKTFSPAKDGYRLAGQHTKVLDAMSDHRWHTLAELEVKTRCPQASISARLRDFRKARFGGMEIERRRSTRAGPASGTFEYRLGA